MVSGTILSVFSQHHPVHFSYTPVSKIPVLNSTLKQRVFWHYFLSIKSALTSTFFPHPCLILEIAVHFFPFQKKESFYKPLIRGLRPMASKKGLSPPEILSEWRLYATMEDSTRSGVCVCGKKGLR